MVHQINTKNILIEIKTKKLLPLIILLATSFAQVNIGDWNAFTCPLDVRAIVQIGDSSYCATGGGILIYNNGDSEIYTTVDGIYKVDILSISNDSYNNLWIGGKSPNGFIQIYNIVNGSIDIFDYGLTEITNFWISDSIAFASFIDGQDFGFIKWVYVDGKWSYRDIYRNFPIELGSINGISVLKKSVFLATNNGLLSIDMSSNLKDPNNWSLAFNDFNNPINTMCEVESGIVFNQNNSLYRIFYNDINLQYEELDIEIPVGFKKIIFDQSGFLWGINGSYVYSEKTNFNPIPIRKPVNNITLNNEGNIIIGSELGLRIIDKDSFEINSYIPNAPVTAKFSSIKVLDDGRLVGASTKGLSIKDFNGWRNILEIKNEDTEVINYTYNYKSFIADTIGYDFGVLVTDIEQDEDGLLYVGIEGTFPNLVNPTRKGGGVLVIDIDNPENVTAIDTSILGFYGTSGNGYTVVKDIEFDKSGNLWVANSYVTNKNTPIHVRDINGNWKSYGSSETSVKISQSPISLTFDNWSRTWVSAFKAEEANMGIYPDGGIFVLEYFGAPVEPSSFSWEKIIYNTTVWSIGFGRNNRLYYLTPTGLNYYDIKAGFNPVIRENLYAYFPNISFGMGSKIDIDSQGNIWTVSQTQGVHVLLENTTYWPDINGLRENSSPLLSDEVHDLDFDQERKLVYIATSKGVSVLRLPFGESYKDYNNIKVFPSPFIIPDNKKLTIDGLMYNSFMKIMTLDGLVIRDINSKGLSVDGDQLIWDGKDNNGRFVSSGVYLLSIMDNSGNNTFTKITVIKK